MPGVTLTRQDKFLATMNASIRKPLKKFQERDERGNGILWEIFYGAQKSGKSVVRDVE